MNKEKEEKIISGKTIAEEYWNNAFPASNGKNKHKYLIEKNVDAFNLKVDAKGNLLMPAYNKNGEIQAIQKICRYNGKFLKFNLSGTVMSGAYFIFTSANKDDEPLLIAEGYATGASLHTATGFETWVSYGADNLVEITKIAREKYRFRKIVICADYDKPVKGFMEKGGVGVAKANKAMLSIGNSYLAVCPHEADEKIDFNDLAVQKGLDILRETILKIINDEPHNACAIPDGFALIKVGDDAGTYKIDKNEKKILLGPPLEVLAKARTKDGMKWGLIVGFHDQDKEYHKIYLSYSKIQVKQGWLPILSEAGWVGNPKYHREIEEYLSAFKPYSSIRLIEKVGWIDNTYYMLGDETYGVTGKENFKMDLNEAAQYYDVHGSYEKWKKYISLCEGNPYFMFVLAMAFSGPLLSLCDSVEGGGFLMYGKSSIGKTTFAQIAASVWGKPDEFVHQWKATVNGIENFAFIHNDNLLILDELAQAKSYELEDSIYTLANGKGKARSTSEGKMDKLKTWKIMILCTGEINIANKLYEYGLGSADTKKSHC